MKKKVGKGFTKILSVILAAAMVVSSAPETSLVVRAEGDPAVTQSSETPEENVEELVTNVDTLNNDGGENLIENRLSTAISNVTTVTEVAFVDDADATITTNYSELGSENEISIKGTGSYNTNTGESTPTYVSTLNIQLDGTYAEQFYISKVYKTGDETKANLYNAGTVTVETDAAPTGDAKIGLTVVLSRVEGWNRVEVPRSSSLPLGGATIHYTESEIATAEDLTDSNIVGNSSEDQFVWQKGGYIYIKGVAAGKTLVNKSGATHPAPTAVTVPTSSSNSAEVTVYKIPVGDYTLAVETKDVDYNITVNADNDIAANVKWGLNATQLNGESEISEAGITFANTVDKGTFDKWLIIEVPNGAAVDGATQINEETDTYGDKDYYQVQTNKDVTVKVTAAATHKTINIKGLWASGNNVSAVTGATRTNSDPDGTATQTGVKGAETFADLVFTVTPTTGKAVKSVTGNTVALVPANNTDTDGDGVKDAIDYTAAVTYTVPAATLNELAKAAATGATDDYTVAVEFEDITYSVTVDNRTEGEVSWAQADDNSTIPSNWSKTGKITYGKTLFVKVPEGAMVTDVLNASPVTFSEKTEGPNDADYDFWYTDTLQKNVKLFVTTGTSKYSVTVADEEELVSGYAVADGASAIPATFSSDPSTVGAVASGKVAFIRVAEGAKVTGAVDRYAETTEDTKYDYYYVTINNADVKVTVASADYKATFTATNHADSESPAEYKVTVTNATNIGSVTFGTAATVTDKTKDVTFKLNPTTGYYVDKVTYTVGEGRAVVLTADKDGKYTIPASALTDNISVEITTKAYVTLTKHTGIVDSSNGAVSSGVSVAYYLNDSTDAMSVADLAKIKKTDKVKAVITVDQTASQDVKVGYQLASQTAVRDITSTAKKVTNAAKYTYEFTISFSTGSKTVSKIVVDRKDWKSIDFKNDNGNDSTGKPKPWSVTGIMYASADVTDAAKQPLSAYKNVSNNRLTAKDGNYFVIINASKPITVKQGSTVKYPKTVAAGVAYEIDMSNDVTITDAANTRTVNFTKDANVKNIYYSAATTINTPVDTNKLVKLDGSSITVDAAATALNVYVEYADHYEVDEVKLNGTVSTGSATVYTLPLTGRDTTSGTTTVYKAATFSVTSKRIVDTYTFAVPENATVEIDTSTLKKITIGGVDKTDDYANNYLKMHAATGASTGDVTSPVVVEVEDGKTIQFNATPDKNYKLPKASIDTTTPTIIDISSGSYAYKYVANKASSGKTITVEGQSLGTETVSFVADNTAKTPDGNHTIQSQLSKITVVNRKKADGTADADLDVTGSTTVQEEATLDFKVVPVDGYAVSKVTYTKPGASKAEELTPVAGVYSIEGGNGTGTVTVFTKINTAKANTVTFTLSEDIESITINGADGSAHKYEGCWKVKSGEPVITLDSVVSYTVKAKTGYAVSEVTGDSRLTTPVNTYNGTVTFTDTVKSSNITIATKATASEYDKYIRINTPSDLRDMANYALNLTGATVIEQKKDYTIYKITKETTEVPFTLTIDSGNKLTDITVSGTSKVGTSVNIDKDVKSVSGKSVTYTGKFVTNQIAGDNTPTADEAERYDIEYTSETKSINLYVEKGGYNEQSAVSVSVDGSNKTWNWISGTTAGTDTYQYAIRSIDVGSKVVLKLNDSKLGLYAYDAKTEKKGDKIVADDYGKYVFTITGDTSFILAEDAEKAEYTVSAQGIYTDEDGEIKKNTVGSAKHADNTFEVELKNEKIVLDIDAITGSTITKLTNVAISGNSKAAIATKADVDKYHGKDSLSVTKDQSAIITVSKDDANAIVPVTLTFQLKNDTTGAISEKTVTANLEFAKALSGLDVSKAQSGASIDVVPGEVLLLKVDGKLPVAINNQKLSDIATISAKSGDATAATKAEFSEIEDSEYIKVTAGTKAETVAVSVKSKVTGKEIYAITVNVKANTYKLASVTSPSQSSNFINVTLTPKDMNFGTKGNVDKNKVVYEVVVTPTGDTVPTGSISGKAYYYPVEIDSTGKGIPVTASVAVNSAKADVAAGKYNITARILVLNSNVALSDPEKADITKAASPVAESSIITAGNSITKTFATRTGYYEDKLSLTKKASSIYNGRDKVTLAQVKYSKNGSVLGRVTGYVLNANGEEQTGFTVEADQQSGLVTVQTPYWVAPGKYTLVVLASGSAETEDDPAVYKASAKMNFTVKQSVYNINETNRKVVLNTSKNTTLTLKPEISGYTNGSKYYKPASTKVTYSIVKDSLSSKNSGKVTVNSKGKITIAKDFVLGSDSADNQFKVKITAADRKQNAYSRIVTVEVTNQAVAPTAIYLVDGNGKKIDKTTLTITELKAANLFVADKDGNKVNDACSFSTSGSIKVNAKDGTFTSKSKPGKVTFIAKTNDVSGKAVKTVKSVKYTITYDTNAKLGLTLAPNAEGDVETQYNTLVETAENYYEYVGTVNTKFGYIMQAITTDEDGNDVLNYAEKSNFKYSISIKGGKLIKGTDPTYETGSIIPSAENTIITINNKATKEVKTITLHNKNFQSAKAPKAKLASGKVVQYQRSELVYSVNTACDYVYITKDATSKVKTYVADGYVPINDGQFKLNVTGCEKGTDKYTVVYGTVKDGVFLPATAPASISIKCSSVANFKEQTKYVYNPYDADSIALKAISGEVVGWSNLRNVNVKGKANNFLKYFSLTGIDSGREDLGYTRYSSAKLVATDKLTEKAMTDGIDPADLTGYVTVSYKDAKGNLKTKDVKITVVIETTQKQYTVDSTTMLSTSGSVAYATVRLDGKAFEISKVEAKDSANWTVETKTIVNKKNNLQITSKKAMEAGSYTVEAYVMPEDAQYNTSDIKKYGTLVSIPVTVVDASTYTGKLAAKYTNINLGKPGRKVTVSTDYGTKSGALWTALIAKEDAVAWKLDGHAEISEVTTSTPGFAVALSAGKIKISTYKKDVELGKSYDVDVVFSFADKSASETITFTVTTPATIQTMSDVATQITTILGKTKYTGTETESSLQSVIAAELQLDAISEVTYEVKKVESVKDSSNVETTKKVTVVLTDKRDSKVTQTVEVQLPTTVETKQKTYAAVQAAVDAAAAKIVRQSDYDALPTTTDAQKAEKATYMYVTNGTTRYGVLDQLKKAVNNDNYMVTLVTFKKYSATDYREGKIEFSYRIVDKKTKYAKSATQTVVIEKTTYQTPSTTVTTP